MNTETGNMSLTEALAARDALKRDAEEAHAMYPQYAGHWDGYLLGRISGQVETKLGVAFEDGDLALVRPILWHHLPATDGFRFAYSNRNGIDTSIPVHQIEMVIG